MAPITPPERTDAAWRGLYRIGGAAAVASALLVRRNIGSEVTLLKAFGLLRGGPALPPSRAGDWFALLQSRPFLALTWFDLFDLVNYALVGLLFLALAAALQRTHPSAMVIATALGLVGVTVYFASHQGFAMLALSHRHAAAATTAERATLEAAGEALLAMHNPGSTAQGTGIRLSLLLVTVANLIVALVMVRSPRFGRTLATLGIVAHVVGLAFFPALAFAEALGPLLAIPPSLSAPFLLVWHLLIGLRLLRMATATPASRGVIDPAAVP